MLLRGSVFPLSWSRLGRCDSLGGNSSITLDTTLRDLGRSDPNRHDQSKEKRKDIALLHDGKRQEKSVESKNVLNVTKHEQSC